MLFFHSVAPLATLGRFELKADLKSNAVFFRHGLNERRLLRIRPGSCAPAAKVLYLRPLIQERISVASGSWFSPRSAVPPHNGVGGWCLKKVCCEVTYVQAHRHSTARSSGLRPDGTSVHPDGRVRLVVISCRQLLFGPGEGRAVTPNAGHDDSQFSRRGNDSFFHSSSRD